jgi:segregation and condensation protein B
MTVQNDRQRTADSGQPAAEPPAAEAQCAAVPEQPVADAADPGDGAPGGVDREGVSDMPGVEADGSGAGATPPAPEGAGDPVAGGVGEPVAEARVGTVSEELKAVIEALVYASPDPLTPKTLFKVLESEPREDVQVSLDALRRDYAEGQGALQLVEVAGGYQIVTRPELSEWVRRLFHERKTQKLSVAALETLAVIAYKQPITAPEITEIRGVSAAGVVATLLERRLIKIAGRKQVVGRPFLYATTREFLIRFGLRDLNDLPRMEDMADVLGFEPPSGLAEAGPSETMLPLETGPDPDKTLDLGLFADAGPAGGDTGPNGPAQD